MSDVTSAASAMNETNDQARFETDLYPGDHAPWFHADCTSNPRYAFDTVAGRYVLLCFFGSAGDPAGAAALQALAAHRHMFDDTRACFFGVSLDPADRDQGRCREAMPGIRFFWDFDGAVSRAYGSIPAETTPKPGLPIRRFWLLLDPMLRVLKILPLVANGAGQDEIFRVLESLPPPHIFAGVELRAPVLFLPNVFEPEFCRMLIDLYETRGGESSGFMRDDGGKTRLMIDPDHKRRRDCLVEDQRIIAAVQARVRRTIVPEIAKVHQFQATRIERYIVACYDEQDGGFFRAHRDNTTKGTAHRRFAVSINLNADFEGGDLVFPEYGRGTLRPPLGGAVVFSCSLLHAVLPVTRGRRFAFLPFLYDDAAAEIREQNNQYLAEGVTAYKRV